MSLYRAVFNWVSKPILRLLCFAIATLCDWLKNLALLYQQIGSKTKTNRDFLARVFPRLAPATLLTSSSDWCIGLSASVVIGQSDYFGFGGFTTLSWHCAIETQFTQPILGHRKLQLVTFRHFTPCGSCTVFALQPQFEKWKYHLTCVLQCTLVAKLRIRGKQS